MKLWERVLNLIYPPACIYCGEGTMALCETCQASLPRLQGTLCKRCGKPPKDCRCEVGLAFDRALAPYPYQGKIRQGVLAFKTHGSALAAKEMGRQMVNTLQTADWGDFAFVTYVPMEKRAATQKGFDHAQLLAKEVATALALPLRPCLQRLPGGESQHRLERAQRMENAQKSYCAKQGLALAGERILLVDDVMTTGATFHHCAKALLQAGAGKVCCLSFATTLLDGSKEESTGG